MIALLVAPEALTDNQMLITLLHRPGTQEAVTKVLEVASRTICTLVNASALESGISVEEIFDSTLTVNLNFKMPTAHDLLDPNTHVEVSRV